MADTKPEEKESQWDWSAHIGWDNDRPGYYASPFEDYQGHIQFPNPFMLPHLQKWWETGIDPLQDTGPLKWKERWQPQYEAAAMLLLDYGKSEIAGIAQGDIKDGNIPSEIAEWLVACSRHYIVNKLDPRKRLALLTVI